MPPFDIREQLSGRFLSFAERENIALLKAQNKGVREIARAVGRDPCRRQVKTDPLAAGEF
jgi:IS30 family transposase